MFTKRSFAVVVSLVAFGPACLSDEDTTAERPEEPEAAAPAGDPAALEVIERVERAFSVDDAPALNAPGLEVARREVGLLAARADAGEVRAAVTLPPAAGAPFEVVDARSGMGVKATLLGARPVPAAVGGGYVVYPGGHEKGDVIHRVTRDGTEDFVHVTAADAAPELRYELELDEDVAGLRLYAGALEFLDAEGTPRLRMRAPHLTDADRRRHPLRVDVEDCSYDADPRPPWGRPVTAPGASRCTVVVRWDARAVRSPLLVDPAWVTAGAMVSPRDSYASAPLSNARLLLIGGRSSPTAPLDTAEIFDADTNTFAATASPPDVASTKGNHAALTLDAGPTLYRTSTASSLYDPSTGAWSSTDPGAPRTFFEEQMVQLADGRVLVPGGRNGPNAISGAELYTYDPGTGTGTWGAAADLDVPAAGGSAVLLQDGDVLLVGEDHLAQVYDPQLDAWSSASAPPLAATGVATRDMVVLTDGTVFLATTPITFGVAWTTYSAQSGSWTTAQSLSTSMPYLGDALPRADGTVLLLGATGGPGVGVKLDVATATETPHAAPSLTFPDEGHHALDEIRVLAATSVGAELLLLGPGDACDDALFCASNHCVDGVCCDTACGGGDPLDCQACSVATGAITDGTCALVAATTACGDPSDSVCDDPDTCDAAGVCQPNHEPTTTICGDSGVDCHGDDFCDGDGLCADGGFLAAGTACGDTQTTACSDPDVCDSAGRCLPSHQPSGTACGDQGVPCHVDDACNGNGVCVDNGFASLGATCGDASADECTAADTCDAAGTCLDNDVASGTACTGGQCFDGACSAIAASCGDGALDDEEACDDGNNVNGDGCAADCMSDETCGNGVVDAAAGEACDDGNTTDGDGCTATCSSSSCGDGVVDAGEACDDGNTTDGDGCSAGCASDETCGNGIVDRSVGELCDEGAENGEGPCSATCTLPSPSGETPRDTTEEGGCSVQPGTRPGGLGWLSLVALLPFVRRLRAGRGARRPRA